MELGPAGKNLIESFEQCRLTAYQDTRKIWTIGWGHTGPEVVEGLTCTQAQADAWFVEDTEKAVVVVNTKVPPVNQNQFDALVSFVFNVGIGNMLASTLRHDLLDHNLAASETEWLRWCHNHDGTVNDGLLRRRKAELALFES